MARKNVSIQIEGQDADGDAVTENLTDTISEGEEVLGEISLQQLVVVADHAGFTGAAREGFIAEAQAVAPLSNDAVKALLAKYQGIHEAAARETAPDATAEATGASNDDAGDGDTTGAGEPTPAPAKNLVEQAYDLFRAGREEDFPLTWSELSDLERTGFCEAAARILAGDEPASNFDCAAWAVLNPIV